MIKLWCDIIYSSSSVQCIYCFDYVGGQKLKTKTCQFEPLR